MKFQLIIDKEKDEQIIYFSIRRSVTKINAQMNK